MAKKYIGSDLTKVYATPASRTAIETLFWGDAVDHIRTQAGRPVIKFRTRDKHGNRKLITAYLSKGTEFTKERPLTVRFIDVGQGDGAIIETPKGRLMVVDGGEGEHIRHYMRAAFGKTKPIPVEVVVATHGDADHFSGLSRLLEAGEAHPTVAPATVFHNGLVKRGGTKKNGTKRKDVEMFGKTVKHDGQVFCVDLVHDIRQVADGEMNVKFLRWKKALTSAKSAAGKKTKVQRLAQGDTIEAFDNEGVSIDVLGPITETVSGRDALRFLHTPGSKGHSASHTVNGHSVVFRLTYGNARFLFAADLNEESEDILLSASREQGVDLTAEVLKVPHHGSADFSMAMLQSVAPVVSIVSSGDESTRTEYIHPRAGLVGALGRASRPSVERPLVYVTEMVAFMERLNAADVKLADNAGVQSSHRLYRKLQFGIVHVRTDGERLLVVVPSGKEDYVEAYAYELDSKGLVRSVEVRKS